MINVVKIGGDIIEDKKMGYHHKMINGRRITDKTTLDIVVMTYSGIINQKIVSNLQSLGLNSLGFSGADGNHINVLLKK